jgi:hypothetical protein
MEALFLWLKSMIDTPATNADAASEHRFHNDGKHVK